MEPSNTPLTSSGGLHGTPDSRVRTRFGTGIQFSFLPIPRSRTIRKPGSGSGWPTVLNMTAAPDPGFVGTITVRLTK